MTCPNAETTAELALGLLSGPERAAALAHVAACPRCGAELPALVEVAERLLPLAPSAEPPAGFESAVLARVGVEGRPRRLPWRAAPLVAAAALVVALVVGGLAGGAIGRSGHDGREAVEAVMRTPAGRDVGSAWRYEGDPGGLLVSVPDWDRWSDADGRYTLVVTLADGRSLTIDGVRFDAGGGAWGSTVAVDVSTIRSVSVTDAGGRVLCTGSFD